MDSAECDCPLCPLIAANVNACNIEMDIVSGKNEPLRVRFTNLGEYAQLHEHFAMLMLMAKNNDKLKIKRGITYTNDTCKYTIDRISKNRFKICFHTI
jgi:hypothetical protein